MLPEPGWRPALRFYLEPDFLIVPRTVVPAKFPGSEVLLAIEIADSSLDYDTTIKRDRFAALGVREYWVIEVWEPKALVHRIPDSTGYRDIEVVCAEALITPAAVPELAFRLADLSIA
ncbi:MAG: Uma2 family endonuclease [Hyphomicrobiaceae bacterium]